MSEDMHDNDSVPSEEEFLRRMCADSAYFEACVSRLLAGMLPGRLEALISRMHFGEPEESDALRPSRKPRNASASRLKPS
jgi:hypothetical protein